jgi:F420-dependent oxidoreductase-like protein
MQFGLQLWPQATDWSTLRDAAVRADGAGFDSIWTWDHLLAIFGPDDQPSLEGWTVLSALAPLTSRARLGLMVGANPFRNPGLTAKIVTTLDHVSGGRANLGIGAAWFEREHDAFGLPFGSGPGERLDRLEEAVGLIRRLLDGERVTHAGRFYTFDDAHAEPPPIQPRLPILIGGSGLRKTIPLVARRADAWNTSGGLESVREQAEALDRACQSIGRDPSSIERTATYSIVVRDDPAAARARFAELLAHNGTASAGGMPALLGPPSLIADGIAPYRELGFETVIVRMVSPFDAETIDRISEVADALGG